MSNLSSSLPLSLLPSLPPPFPQASQSILDVGHIAAALLQQTCNIPPPSLPQAFHEKVLRPLDLTGEVFLGGFKQGVNGNAR